MATRRQRAKQRQPQPPEPAADYEHIGVVLRLRPLLRWERREGFREAVSKCADAALQVDGPQPKLCRCDKAFDGDTGQREFFRDSGVVPLIDSSLRASEAQHLHMDKRSAGKTYTMVGGDDALGGLVQSRRGRRRRRAETPGTDEDDGLLPRALAHVFASGRIT